MIDADFIPEERGCTRDYANVENESRLHEAKRKRLLTQHDWIGVNASRPVNLRDLADKERNVIGKRRKTEEGKYGATARLAKNGDLVDITPQRASVAHVGMLTNAVRRDDLDRVRIRIGTDALTSMETPQPYECVQSPAPSDLMLYDEENSNAGQNEQSELARPVNHRLLTALTASPRMYSPLSGDPEHPSNFGPHHQLHALRNSSSGANSEMPDSAQITVPWSESSTCGLRIVHHNESAEQPLRLVFAESESSTGDRLGTFRNSASAGATRTGRVHEVEDDEANATFNKAPAARAIVDEQSWKTFLAISDVESSRPDTTIEPGNRIQRPYPTVQDNNEAIANWSQIATHGISSPAISASLPSLRRLVPAFSSSAHPIRTHRLDGALSQGLDEDEKLWQAFVFGSDKDSSSVIFNPEGREQTISKVVGETTRLPWSAVVSSLSSTPFTPLSGRASCISNHAHDAAGFTPPSGPRLVSSPVCDGYIEDESNSAQGNVFSERGGFGEHSHQPAWLQNHACCETDLDASKMLSGTRTSRHGPDRPLCARDMICTQAKASRRDFERNTQLNSPNYGILVSSDSVEGIHLVDPDSLE